MSIILWLLRVIDNKLKLPCSIHTCALRKCGNCDRYVVESKWRCVYTSLAQLIKKATRVTEPRVADLRLKGVHYVHTFICTYTCVTCRLLIRQNRFYTTIRSLEYVARHFHSSLSTHTASFAIMC